MVLSLLTHGGVQYKQEIVTMGVQYKQEFLDAHSPLPVFKIFRVKSAKKSGGQDTLIFKDSHKSTYLPRRTTCTSKITSVFSILDHNGSDLTRVRT
jgi:hypothetical protein